MSKAPIAEPEGEIEPPQSVMLATMALFVGLCVLCWIWDTVKRR